MKDLQGEMSAFSIYHGWIQEAKITGHPRRRDFYEELIDEIFYDLRDVSNE